MKQKFAAMFVAVLAVFALPMVQAQSLGAQETTTAQAEIDIDAGVAPDSPFYGLDVAIDRLALAFTFGAEAKSEKALEISRERLAEVKAMLEAKKDAHAERAAEEHAAFMTEAETNLDLVQAESEDAELAIKTKIEAKLISHLDKIQRLKLQLAEKQEILNRLEQRAEKFEAKLDAREQSIIEKLRSKGVTDEEIQEKIDSAHEKIENKLKERAPDQIEKAKEAIEEAKEKVDENSTEARLLAEAEAKLEIAEQALEDGKLGMSFGQARAAEKLAINAERIAEKPEINENSAKENIEDLIEKAEKLIQEAEQELADNPEAANVKVKVDAKLCALTNAPICLHKVEKTPAELIEDAKNDLALAREALENNKLGKASSFAQMSFFEAAQAKKLLEGKIKMGRGSESGE